MKPQFAFILTALSLTPNFAVAQTPIQEVFSPPVPDQPAAFGKVAVVQWNYGPPSQVGPTVTAAQAEQYKQGARNELAGYVRTAAAQGAKLIITPEFGIDNYPDIPELPSEEDDYRNREDIAPYVETVPGPTTDYFGKISKELGVYIHVGFAEVDPATNKYYNTVAVLDPSGKVATKFRKINLYQLENQFLSPGTSSVTYRNKFFGTIGLAICADIGAWNPMNDYRGIDAVALSTSWAQMDGGMSAFRSAAMRARTPVLAANNTYFPDSGVINSDGTNQSWIRQSTGIAYGYLPLKLDETSIARLRRAMKRP